MCLPFPGQDLAVADIFYLESRGRFRLQVVTPRRMSGEKMRKGTQSTLTGRLIVDVVAPDRPNGQRPAPFTGRFEMLNQPTSSYSFAKATPDGRCMWP